MEGAWFTGLADELAQCLTDAETCAAACEELLESVTAAGDAELQRAVASALVAPAAISRVLIDLIDHPADLVLAACRLCREAARSAVGQLEALGDRVDAAAALAALRAIADSCERLIAAAA
jgi:hypothetical protein